MHHASEFCRNLSVETTDFCNQRCGYCNQTNKIDSMHGSDTKNAFMDMELFKTIVDRMSLRNPPFDSFTPYWGGEPLLHPKTADMLRYLFERNKQKRFFNGFLMNTNGYFLTDEIARLLMDYAAFMEAEQVNGGMHITFSLDAVTPTTYSRIRRVPEHQLARVVSNIDALLDLRAKQGLKKPSLTCQFVVCEENLGELESIFTYWKDRLDARGIPYEVITDVSYFNDRDAIFFRQLDDGRYEEAARGRLLHQQAMARLRLPTPSNGNHGDGMFAPAEAVPTQQDWLKRKKPCFQLWNMMVVSKDGNVVPCCKDLFFELKLGNVKTHSFDQMWSGEQLKQFRLHQIQGRFESYAVCSNCIHPPGGELGLTEVIDYLCDIDRLDLLASYIDRVS